MIHPNFLRFVYCHLHNFYAARNPLIPNIEEQFILRVPPFIAERIDRLLNDNASLEKEKSLDLSFSDDGRSGMFVIGNDHFPASLLDLPCIVESYKTYDDGVLIKTADIGQMIMVREEGDCAADVVDYRHGVTPPMRDARRRSFRREPNLNVREMSVASNKNYENYQHMTVHHVAQPELVRRLEKDLLKIMAGGTAENAASVSHVEVAEQDEGGSSSSKKAAPIVAPKPDVSEAGTNAEEPERSDSNESG